MPADGVGPREGVPTDSRSCLPSAPFALGFIAAVVLAWSALPALLQSVPHADNVEQLDWAHALQWGYVKHPPLPTWILYAALQALPPSAFLTYALAMLCVGATLMILWTSARALLGHEAALLVLLLTSADYYLMGRGSFLNHNTVMLPFVAASAWAVLRIAHGSGGAAAWAVLGLAQALGMLTKYQMAIVIAANAIALLAAGVLRRPRAARHIALCAAATLVPLVPHLLWVRAHDYSTFAYAGHSLLADLPAGTRVLHALGFVIQQVGRFAPALLAFALAFAFQSRARLPATGPEAVQRDPQLVRTVAFLALTPGSLVILLTLFGGVAPQNHWGASSTLLIPLLAVVALPRRLRLQPAPAFAAVLTAHAGAVLWNVVDANHRPGFHHAFAAQPLAALALDHWRAHAGGQIRVVVGPDWEAGAIALELPSYPSVLGSGDRREAPWISDETLERCGALVLWRPGQEPGAQVGADFARRIEFPVRLQTTVPRGRESSINAAILPPQGAGCP